MEGLVIVQNEHILVPVERILREYDHLAPYLKEHTLEVKDLIELSFTVSNLNQSFDLKPHLTWSTLSIMSDYLIAHRPAGKPEMTDQEAIDIHNLTVLASEIHDRVWGMVNQYTPLPHYGYHEIRRWIGNNILIEPFR